ncbi:uncharacterized protein LOC122282303 [Carya illinoinensis]|uniref:uncharacterized protein LOC122282303 n=1 Tax=Carya illinoinensis TaxID=32201 RepID=UPI001C723ADD|nr:uncharacterized protein LOC122282303 [Carya illinoinensis]
MVISGKRGRRGRIRPQRPLIVSSQLDEAPALVPPTRRLRDFINPIIDASPEAVPTEGIEVPNLVDFVLDWTRENHHEAVANSLADTYNAYHYELHKHYKKFASHEEVLAGRKEWVKPHVWEWLCQMGASPKFKEQSRRNNNNRKKQKVRHTSGRKSFVRLMEERGEEARNMIEFYKETHWSNEKGKFINAASEHNYNLMLKRLNEKETEEDVQEAAGDVFKEVLGFKFGYKCQGIHHIASEDLLNHVLEKTIVFCDGTKGFMHRTHFRDSMNGNHAEMSKIWNIIGQVLDPVMEEFKRISMCQNCKEAWDILEITHEGDKILENRVVRKVLRSLPERFRPKVTAIEESKDVDTMRIEELDRNSEKHTRTNRDKGQSSVQCHECHGFGHIRLECANYKKAKERAKIASLSESESKSNDSSGISSPKRNLNYMAFTVSVDSKSEHSENVLDDESKSGNESEYEDELQEVYEKLYKECIKLRKLNKLDEILNFGKSPSDKSGLGYDVVNSETATTSKVSHKNEKKIVFVCESVVNGKINPSDKGKKSSHVQMGVLSHMKLRTRNARPICHHCGKTGHVVTECFKLKRYITYEHAPSQSKSMHPPNMGKRLITAPKYTSSFRRQRDSKENYVCHNCGRAGHIRPNCYELRKKHMKNGDRQPRRGHLNLWSQVMALTRQNEMLNVKLDQLSTTKKGGSPKVRKMWVRTGERNTCHVAHIALKTRDTYVWYLDNGCSRHMSGDRSLFKTVEEYKCGTVTFGDGGKADIIGKGEIDILGLPVLREVLFVDGLKANLLSISQMCDNGAEVCFSKEKCIVSDNDGNCMMQGTRTSDNCYDITPNFQYSCNSAKSEATDLWHQRLGHVNHKNLSKIAKKDMVIGLPELGKVETPVCGSCQLGKQVRIAHKKTTAILTEQPLELLHIDLMGPSRIESLGEKRYILVMVDDFTRYSWVEFLREKVEAPNVIKILCKKLQNEQGKVIVRIRSDHGREFDNSNLENLCDEEGISQEFSAPITPQQNRVVERKNRVIQEMARVMIHSKNVPTHFWGEAVNTACHIVNRVYPRPNTSKTPYELWKGKKPNVKYFIVFGSQCYILRDRENLAKFDPKSDEGIFLGYARNSRAYRCYNLHTRTEIESINVVVNDAPEEKLNKDEPSHLPNGTEREDSDAVRENLESASNEKIRSQKEPSSRVKLNHPQENIIGNIDEGMRLGRKVINQLAHSSYISQIEPKRGRRSLK